MKNKLIPEETIKFWQQRSLLAKDPLAKVMWPDRPVWNIYMDNLQTYYLKPYIQRLKRSDKVLDAGCGIGRFTFRLAKFCGQVYGVDAAEANIKFAIENKRRENYDNIKFQVMDLRRLDFSNEMFDYVFCILTLCQITHRKDFILAFRELLRVMKKTGKMVLLENTQIGENYISISREEWFKIIKRCGGKINYWCGLDIPLLRKIIVEFPFGIVCKFITRRKWKLRKNLFERDKELLEAYATQGSKYKTIENFVMKILTNLLKPFEYTIPKFLKSRSKYILIEVAKI